MRRFLPILLFAGLAAAQDTRQVSEPVIPPACAVLNANLTNPDEAHPDTQRIQDALDKCGAGKAVTLAAQGPRKAFLSGPLQLRTGVTLHVDTGVTLYASRDPRAYDRRPGVCGTIDERGHGCKALINGDNVAGAGVVGGGAIDGQGGEKILGQEKTWWQLADDARKGGTQNNPRIMILSRCDNFTLYRISLKNSPNFHVAYSGGNGFTVWGVKLQSPKRARNTDGIDPGTSTNVTIAHSFIDTGDDNVAIKAGGPGATTHITIAHNHFYSGHGMSIGSETEGGASAIRVTDLSIEGADNGLRIKSNSSRGGLVQDVVYEDVCIRNTRNPILMDSNYSFQGKERDKLPTFRGIVLRNVTIEGGGKISLNGFDPVHKLGIRFENVHLDTPDKVKIAAVHADVALGPGVNFTASGEDVKVTGGIGVQPPAHACSGKFVPFPVN
jgi:polygalacturonase